MRTRRQIILAGLLVVVLISFFITLLLWITWSINGEFTWVGFMTTTKGYLRFLMRILVPGLILVLVISWIGRSLTLPR